MKNLIALSLLFVSSIALAAPSLITGSIVKVVPEKKEIYVKDEAGKKHEYYFNAQTEVTKAGGKVDFAELKEGQKVTVKAEKKGKRLDPISVEVLN